MTQEETHLEAVKRIAGNLTQESPELRILLWHMRSHLEEMQQEKAAPETGYVAVCNCLPGWPVNRSCPMHGSKQSTMTISTTTSTHESAPACEHWWTVRPYSGRSQPERLTIYCTRWSCEAEMIYEVVSESVTTEAWGK